jgi:GT2 family glycosyltransferase
MSKLRIWILRVAARGLWQLIAPMRSFISRRKRIARLVQQLLFRFPSLDDAVLELVRGDPEERYDAWVSAYDTVDELDLMTMKDELLSFDAPPLLSILVPIACASEAMLEALSQSLLRQVYQRWEVTFVFEAPIDEAVSAFLSRAPSLDSRFKATSERRVPLAEAWNAALHSATGELAVLVDPRVLLRPHALFLLARTIDSHPDAVLIYADEDLIDETGRRSGHHFKPEWNEVLMRSQNYLGGLVLFSRSRALAVGGCEEELDDDCMWGLFLRMTADTPPHAIHHLPFILGHRRIGEPGAEPDDAQRRERVSRALERRLARIGDRVHALPVGEASYRAHHGLPEKPPLVSVIVPTTINLEFLRPCLDGVLNRTSYAELEVLLVVNGTRRNAPAQREYLEAVAASPRVRTLLYEDRQYNFSRTNNWAAERAQGELLCFLNDDTDVIESDWLSAMVAHALQDRVAAVGGMLVYPNNRIQHAGVVLGAGGVAAHTYSRKARDTRGYHDRALVAQDVSCVTAACMLVRRHVFLDVGGFDETLAIAYNDVDFCLRVRDAGWRIVWTPNAELYHKESASIGRHDADKRRDQWVFESNLMRSRWGVELTSDPHYSPNLSLDALELWEPAFPPRVPCPWRVPDLSRITAASRR